MIDRKAADAFWQLVTACLMGFHGFSESEADRESLDLRRRIESPPVGLSSDIFYHEEPFFVACDLAERDLDLSEYRHQFDAISDYYRW